MPEHRQPDQRTGSLFGMSSIAGRLATVATRLAARAVGRRVGRLVRLRARQLDTAAVDSEQRKAMHLPARGQRLA